MQAQDGVDDARAGSAHTQQTAHEFEAVHEQLVAHRPHRIQYWYENGTIISDAVHGTVWIPNAELAGDASKDEQAEDGEDAELNEKLRRFLGGERVILIEEES